MDFIPVVFKIENEEYGIDINFVRGIETAVNVYPSELKSDNIIGKIENRGRTFYIFDLKKKFGWDSNVSGNDNDKSYIIVGNDKMEFVIEADSVEKIDMDAKQKLFEVPAIIKSEKTKFYDKILKIDERIIVILNIENLLTDEETKQLAISH